MKKTIKGYILGFLTAVILISGVTYATQTVRIVLNGTELVPTDVTGKRVDPILVEGTTYLPVRAIANALGLNVGWDEATYTVSLDELEKPEGETPAEEEKQAEEEKTEEKPDQEPVVEQVTEDANVIEGIGQIIVNKMDDEVSKIQDEKTKKIYTVDGVYMLGDWGHYRIVDGNLEYFNVIDHYGWTRATVEKFGRVNVDHFAPRIQFKLTDGTVLTLLPRKVRINGTSFNLEEDEISESIVNAVQKAIGIGDIWYKTDEDGYVTHVDKIN